MPGKRITGRQVLEYNVRRRTHTQAAAAAKAGISERSARRIETARITASTTAAAPMATRPDPLAAIWETDLLPMLRQSPHLSAVTLLEELQRRYPGE